MRRVQSVCLRVAALGAAAGAMMMSSLPARCDELSPAAQRGLTIMRTNCARCHSIDKVSESPLRIAPPFRTLHQRYPVESLEKSLSEGIITGHPTMPEFRFDPGQVADVIAYLKSLER
jgi:mono/diheme cytochrome c family protein